MALFAFGFGPWQLIIILVIVLLIFGNRLPATMRSLGRGVTEFKKGLSGEPEEGEEDTKKEIKDEAKKDAAK